MKFLLLLLLIHGIFCTVVLLLRISGILLFRPSVYFISVTVPVFGWFMLLLHSLTRQNADPVSGKLLADGTQEDLSLPDTASDDMERMVRVEKEDDTQNILPLTDVLRMHSVDHKRAMLMDILYSNPEEFIGQLTEASTNEDPEVVHYAVTALVEIQKNYDLRIQDALKEMKEDPNDKNVLLRYQNLLEQYISSGILSESQRDVQLQNLLGVLKRRIRSGTADYSVYLKKAEVDYWRRDKARLKKDAAQLIDRWPDAEGGYLFMIHSCILSKDREGIDHMMKEIQRKQVHLSPEGRRIVEFWKRDPEEKSVLA